MECLNQIPFCKVKCCACDCVGKEETCPYHKVDCGGENVPSIGQWKNVYWTISGLRHDAVGTLDITARRSVIATLEEFRRVMEFSDDDKVTVINRKSIATYLSRLSGIRDVSRKSKAEKLQQCFSKWARQEVEDTWIIPKFELPEINGDYERFHELPREVMVKILKWYRSLYGRGRGQFKGRARIYTMFAISYALRCSDIDRLKWTDIKCFNGRHRLIYTPHKTRLSSKRKVKIWMNDLDYDDLIEFKNNLKHGSRYDNEYIFGGGKNLSLKNTLNKEIGELGVPPGKRLHLLRKICIHQSFIARGRDYASAISGDRFDILRKSYIDEENFDIEPPVY